MQPERSRNTTVPSSNQTWLAGKSVLFDDFPIKCICLQGILPIKTSADRWCSWIFPCFHISLSPSPSPGVQVKTHTYIYILHRLPFIDYVHDFSYLTTLKPEIYRQTYHRSVPPESACASNAWLQGVHVVQIIHAMGICHEIYPMVDYIYIYGKPMHLLGIWSNGGCSAFMLVYRKVSWFSCTIY